MLAEGLFERFPVEAVFGLHNWPGLPVGSFAVSPGPVMASANVFKVVVHGRGSHAALPHGGVDPVLVACQLVQAWRYNPLGIVVVVGSMLLVARALLGLVSRLWLNVHVEMTARSRRVVFTTFAILIALLEIRQQGRAELLMAATHAAGA